jgi:hypothetical protein
MNGVQPENEQGSAKNIPRSAKNEPDTIRL